MAVESLGYRVVANVGDQFSDLQGDHEQPAVTLPNPMYFIPWARMVPAGRARTRQPGRARNPPTG